MIAAVAVGGAIGALLRWALGEQFPDSGGFPWTTFTINATGSFLLAALPAIGPILRHPVIPVFVGTGMLGGYTTLSTYAEQVRVLLADGSYAVGAAYLVGSVVACIGGVLLAHRFSSVVAQAEFELEEGNE